MKTAVETFLLLPPAFPSLCLHLCVARFLPLRLFILSLTLPQSLSFSPSLSLSFALTLSHSLSVSLSLSLFGSLHWVKSFDFCSLCSA